MGIGKIVKRKVNIEKAKFKVKDLPTTDLKFAVKNRKGNSVAFRRAAELELEKRKPTIARKPTRARKPTKAKTFFKEKSSIDDDFPTTDFLKSDFGRVKTGLSDDVFGFNKKKKK